MQGAARANQCRAKKNGIHRQRGNQHAAQGGGIIQPLMRPTKAAIRRQTAIPVSIVSERPTITLVETMFDIVTTPATETSIPPTSKARVCPVATTPRNAETCSMLRT